MNPLRSLYIDLNSFFASCEQQMHPELRGKPIAVVPMLADTTAVIAASYPAKAFGIKTGTRVGDAKRMCPGLILVPCHHAPYVKFHHKIIEAVESVIPVRAVRSIDEIACELTGSQQRKENIAPLVAKIKNAIATQVGDQLKCSIGVSTNFLLAKIACDFQKPDGFTLMDDEDRLAKLSTLKLQDVPGIGPRMEKRLWARGITTMAQLLSKNEHEMRGLWESIVGAKYHRLLNGIWADFEDGADTQSIGHSHVLPPAERNYGGALKVAQKLLSKVAIRLRGVKLMTSAVSLSIRYLDQTKFRRELRFHETQDTGFLLRCIEQMYAESPKGLKPLKVDIVVSRLNSESQHQLSFFEDGRRGEAYKIMDQINQKFGRDTIYVGSLQKSASRAPTRIAFSRIPGLDEVD